MTVAELIAKLQKMPQDKEVIMFDGPSQYTPYKVEVADWGGKNIKGKVIIDWMGYCIGNKEPFYGIVVTADGKVWDEDTEEVIKPAR